MSSAGSFFLYLHYLDPHNPYRVHDGITPPRKMFPGRSDRLIGLKPGSGTLMESEEERQAEFDFTKAEVERMRELYDGEVTYVDRNLEVLFEALEARGLLKRSIVVLTSDHDEEFGEHGVFGHGATLFGPVSRVPLVVVLPDGFRSHVEAPVEIGGVGPAILNELSIPVPDDFTIAPLPVRNKPEAGNLVYLDLPIAPQLKLHMHRRGTVGAKTKLLVSDDASEHFFALGEDGSESAAIPNAVDAAPLRHALARVSALETGQQPKAQTKHRPSMNNS